MATVEEVLAAMERVVRAATPGPWAARPTERGQQRVGSLAPHVSGHTCNGHVECCDGFIAEFPYPGDFDNAALVAMFDPPTLTALLAVARAAQGALTFADGVHQDGCPVPTDACDFPGEPCTCGFQAITDALDALTRPPQGVGEE